MPKIVVSTFTLLVALSLTACATSKHPPAATGNQASPLKFSQCMRAQGLSWYPDPQADGGLKVSVPDGTDQSKVDQAEQACKAYEPGAAGNGPLLGADDLGKLRRVSQCMRDKGYSKYPDPDAHGTVQIDSKVLGVEPTDPAFKKAIEDCQKYLPSPKAKG